MINDVAAVKSLILYALTQIGMTVPREHLDRTVMADRTVDYLTYNVCLDDLVEDGFALYSDGCYAIANRGRELAGLLDIPACSRAAVNQAATAARARLRVESGITAESYERDGSLFVKCVMRDGDEPMLVLELMVGSEEQAGVIQTNFRAHAETIYNKVLGVILTPNGGHI